MDTQTVGSGNRPRGPVRARPTKRGKPMSARTIGYWATTGLVAFVFLSSGATDLARPGFVVERMSRLGYPLYLATILGVWKLLGAGVVLAPGLPTLKEWAYAGMIFDLTGAAASHVALGDPAAEMAVPLVIAALVAA